VSTSGALDARRIVLMHPSRDLLDHRSEIPEQIAEDRLTFLI
jgi:hypothetical protein